AAGATGSALCRRTLCGGTLRPSLLGPLLRLSPLLRCRLGSVLSTFRALLLPGLRAVRAFFSEILPVVDPVFAGVLPMFVIVVPRAGVHVGATMPPVRPVVVVVVHRRANGDAGRESDQARRDGDVGIVVLLDDDRRVGRRLRVDHLRVVLRHVDDLW